MKIAVLCLCLFTIAFAFPVKKGKFHHDSVSSEEKHDSRGHHVHKHHHRHHHSHSQSQEHSPEHMNSHESRKHQLTSHLSSDSFESDEIPQPHTLLLLSHKSKESGHSDMDDHDDVDDHVDTDDDSHSEADDSDRSHDSDDSHQVTAEVPTDDPLTPSAAPGPFTGRGDTPYKVQGVPLAYAKRSEKFFSSKQFDSHDNSQEDGSIQDMDSHESLETQEDKSNLHGFYKLHGTYHHKSVEKDSHQTPDSVEEGHDNSKADTSHESYGSDHHSIKKLKARRGESEEANHDHDGDHDEDSVHNQSIESAIDHHSVEDNEIEK